MRTVGFAKKKKKKRGTKAKKKIQQRHYQGINFISSSTANSSQPQIRPASESDRPLSCRPALIRSRQSLDDPRSTSYACFGPSASVPRPQIYYSIRRCLGCTSGHLSLGRFFSIQGSFSGRRYFPYSPLLFSLDVQKGGTLRSLHPPIFCLPEHTRSRG